MFADTAAEQAHPFLFVYTNHAYSLSAFGVNQKMHNVVRVAHIETLDSPVDTLQRTRLHRL